MQSAARDDAMPVMRERDVRVFVALGSNLGDRREHIEAACVDIASLEGIDGLVCSSIYETEPMGPQDQPDYLNAVCAFDYIGTAHALLSQLQEIERQHGRVHGGMRWGARPLDLDIVLFGDEVIDEPDLKVPHIGLAERSFVLWPLVEIAPGTIVPGLGSVDVLRLHCQQFGIRRHDAGRTSG